MSRYETTPRANRKGWARGWRMLLVALMALLSIVALPAHAASPGSVVAWGNNDFQQTDVPADVANVIAVAGGKRHSLALKSDGTVVAWGCKPYGISAQCDVPAGLTNVTAIAAGGFHSLALKSDGSLVFWGRNQENDDEGMTVPNGLANVTAIASGLHHMLALTSNGSVVAWGCNNNWDYGQCIVPAAAQSGVIAIAGGATHSLALKSDGSLIGWGCLYNQYGQCAAPAGLTDVRTIAAGGRHNLALTYDGSVVAWGDNSDGQTNVPAAAQSGVIAIAAGNYHSLALKSDGTVVAWGGNSFGEIDVPAGLPPVSAIAAGFLHSLAVVADAIVPVKLSLSSTSLPENQPSGTSVGIFTTNASAPGAPFSYAFVSGTGDTDNASFSISGATLKTGASFDYETKSRYSIRVRGTNASGLSAVKSFTITIIDGNDAPTVVVAVGGRCVSDGSGQINLTMADPDSYNDYLALSASSSNTTLVPMSAITLAGTDANRTATISTISGKTGTATVTITISDGQATSSVSVIVQAGGNGNDALVGSAGADMLFGQNGKDTLKGLGGVDLLCGGRGSDRLMGGGAADHFDGGQGRDSVADYNAAEGDTKVNLP